ncbi:hypothetical protein PHYPSEUDO_012568 [Phytophthora pseudosyringae]|uniref:Uncharacterized protein n=1 Tax=Phytophthora pseudosyringae TaxID=221518 RepID=A0A8T1V7E9_9STRA|nr:hypothetical protein PHYPSEUDO_012568 [Phytophthora pseudosyringae]
MASSAGHVSEGSVSAEELENCYAAFVLRRRTRGERSLRTSVGFRSLQKRYGSKPTGDHETDRQIVVNAFFNPKISRVITETCWRLAHFGGGSSSDERDCAGLELDAEKYSTFTLRLIQWVCPELPRRDVQELAQNDWQLDREFDALGRDGLSLEGFRVSLLDLALSCTDGTVHKCLEFLNLMARWLQHSLPPYARDVSPPVGKDLGRASSSLELLPKAALPSIVWDSIPLAIMTPRQLGPQGLYCELKAKVCSAPMAIMVLAADENPIEVVLATSSKLLLSKMGNHKSRYCKVTLGNTLCGELRGQGCWAFCMSPKTPSILLVPGSNISRQTKTLYACFRALGTGMEPHTETDESDNDNKRSPPTAASSETTSSPPAPSLLTLFTSVPDPSPLRFDSKNNTCHRMERMSSRIFTIERCVRLDEVFAVTVTASLLQNTNSAGAAVSTNCDAKSSFTVCDNDSADRRERGDGRLLDAHTFVFVLKRAGLTTARKNGLKKDEATQPQQWFTSLTAANETRTIIFEAPAHSPPAVESNGNDTKETPRTEIYQLFIFTLHGVCIEVACDAENPGQQQEGTDPESQEVEGGEVDDPNVLFSKDSDVTSARLLQELLLLQKMRKLEKTAEPPPDMIIGTPVSSTKPVSTAESLRSKILRSRQDERYARVQKLEAAIRSKFLESKRRRKPSPAVQEIAEHTEAAPPSPNSELEQRVNSLTTFFHEMAVHQPKLDELHASGVEAAEVEVEERLLKGFGDMFDLDTDLQNALDEEKWSTATAKVTRRRDSISTALPKRMPAEDVTATRDGIDEGTNQWTFEDYENTAQYIEQLMVDVATHTTQQQETSDAERKRAVMTQLIASWQYTQHRVSKAATRKRVKEMEQQRRAQWMQSQHVQTHNAIVSAKRGDRPERPAFILPKQRFLVQEHSLPSNAIWEAPVTSTTESSLFSGPIAAAGLLRPGRPTSPRTENVGPSPSKLRPQRPHHRPVTGAAVERPTSTVALNSAAISRARVRRIRSARCSTVRGESTLQPRRISSVLSPSDLNQPKRGEFPPQHEEPVAPSTPASFWTISTKEPKEDSNQLPDSPCISVLDEPTEVFNPPTKRESPVAVDTKEASTERRSARRVKNKRRSKPPKDVHFRRRVLELVSISAQLQAEERKEAQGVGGC